MPEVFKGVIARIINAIGYNNPDQKWVVIESVALLVHGVQLDPDDLDILANEAAFYAICELFKDNLCYAPQYGKTNLFESTIARFNFEGRQVELMMNFKKNLQGTWKDISYLLDKHSVIDFEGLSIPVASIRESYSIYSQLGRSKDVAKLPLIKARIKELFFS